MITIVAPYYTPAVKAGGPVKSIHGLTQILSANALACKVITRNHDIDGSLLDAQAYEPHATYITKPTSSQFALWFKDSNIVWINSLYSIPFGLKPILALRKSKGKAVIISPRGQLLGGSVNLRKRVYLVVFKLILKLLKHKIVVHYTNLPEQQRSVSTFSNYPAITMNNPIRGIQKSRIGGRSNGEFIIGIFGRVSPIKNIEFVIQVLAKLPKGVSLQIHGSLEDTEYKNRLDNLASELLISDRISFCGNYNKDTFVAKADGVDVVAIPSLSENFCHVFFEAIEAGKLVVASNGLPWEAANTLVPQTVLPLEVTTWEQRICNIIELTNDQYLADQVKLVEFYNSIDHKIQQDVLEHIKNLLPKHGTKE